MAVALTILLAQFPVVLVELERDPLYHYSVQLVLADLAFGVVAVIGMPAVVGHALHGSLTGRLAAGMLALTVVALAVHPSLTGLQTVLRLAAAFALAALVVDARDDLRLLVAGAAGVTAMTQTALAVVQDVRRAPIGLPAIGEFADPLLAVGDSVAPRGTMTHPYVLAGLCLVTGALLVARALVARDPRPWLIAAALVMVPVGLTYSRTSVVALGLGCLVLAPMALRGSRRHRFAIAALLIGAGVPALVASDGWTARAETSFRGRPIREILALQAIDLTLSSPVVGIGPGRTPAALRELSAREPGSVTLVQPVHDVPLLVAEEMGVPAGAVLVALLVAVGLASRRSELALFAYVTFLPFVLLDHYPLTHPQGLVLLGLWLGWTRRESAATA